MSELYPGYRNPLIIKPERPLPSKIAVVGAGGIGPDIGYFFKSALPEAELVFVDIIEEALKGASRRLEAYVQKALSLRKMTPEKAEKVRSKVSYTTDYSEIRGAELVIEAVTENLEVKKKVFRQVEELVDDDAILGSNTSAIPAARIFADIRNPRRATNVHFFAPAWRNPGLEITVWEKVEREIVDYLYWLFCYLGKAPILVNDAIGYVLSRVFDNWCNDAALLLEEKVATAPEIDKAAEEFVVAGPFYVLNLAKGNPIIVKANTLQMEEGEHYRPAKIFHSVESWRTFRPGSRFEVPPEVAGTVKDRLLGVFFSQSCEAVDRGIALIDDVNMGCQVALAFRKGPFDFMRDLGEAEFRRIMEKYGCERPGMPQPQHDFQYYQNFYRNILVDNLDGVKLITIRRPHVLNALNDEVNNEILDVLKKFEGDAEVKGFIIAGYGPSVFCAGADIGRFPEVFGNAEAAANYAREFSKLFTYIDGMSKPVVAAVNGITLGGGLELAVRCHRILATKNAWFQFPEVTLGILPGVGGMVVPYRRWARSRKEVSEVFHKMVRFARRLTVQEAYKLGMVSKIAEDYSELIKLAVSAVEELEGKVERIPEGPVEIAELTPVETPMAESLPLSREVDLVVCKAIREAAAAQTLAEALEISYKAFGEVACLEAAREGISAFMQRRKPSFKK
ncbi:MAG: 3-hydroxyacyl-CoA dehydrogenase/enoyl-CoA hydratase family protein [Candidatus Hecatellales archaeon]|nr:MAG: 3-hydroxyacyl-CoA dehydrogenase/enoyl-CoA hydratase family protein [Candidatus Hecatellales archaeon]